MEETQCLNLTEKHKIKERVRDFFDSLVFADYKELERTITPNRFTEIEIIIKDNDIISEEINEFSKEEFIDFCKELFRRRDYIMFQTNNEEIFKKGEKYIFTADILIEVKDKENEQINSYGNAKTTLELDKLNGDWYISEFENMITI
ncbi:hypothetical protein U472_05655 [Orenia metallireducens]|jgi:hypothetical protein|uniref:SnoaL-like domain-containing protein n=1 Tax=Orenia metallireducens TaxID=1413210 RepID=A0A1C0A9K8_9FIRM|nr:hypothetical protein [Orenia metallireducens]OCL26971.1 hypothetical protein U472_05655 [Orenia metallireducens]